MGGIFLCHAGNFGCLLSYRQCLYHGFHIHLCSGIHDGVNFFLRQFLHRLFQRVCKACKPCIQYRLQLRKEDVENGIKFFWLAHDISHLPGNIIPVCIRQASERITFGVILLTIFHPDSRQLINPGKGADFFGFGEYPIPFRGAVGSIVTDNMPSEVVRLIIFFQLRCGS